jgi:hypothetical protein
MLRSILLHLIKMRHMMDRHFGLRPLDGEFEFIGGQDEQGSFSFFLVLAMVKVKF